MNLVSGALVALLLAGCATTSPVERGRAMDALASASHWQKLRLAAGEFVLTAYAPAPAPASKQLVVYIEGDGLAWLTPSIASDDPTPRAPVALELALRHTGAGVAYLARPCQNVAPADWGTCAEPYWTGARYGTSVVDASDRAVSALKARSGADTLVLVGFSGGGTIAALLAARRTDVTRIVTIAGNLDIAASAAHHRVPPLSGSLNPADDWARLQSIPQLHFVGDKDRVAPPSLATAYADRFPANRRPAIRVVPEFTHSCCWAAEWPRLAREAFP